MKKSQITEDKLIGFTNKVQCNHVFNMAVKATIPPHLLDDSHILGLSSVFNDLDAQNPIETMLISQMSALHAYTMRMMSSLNKETYSVTMNDNLVSHINKSMRTFAKQAEAYEKLKRNGHQTIKVNHVHVNGGGQAIVGNIEQHNDRVY